MVLLTADDGIVGSNTKLAQRGSEEKKDLWKEYREEFSGQVAIKNHKPHKRCLKLLMSNDCTIPLDHLLLALLQHVTGRRRAGRARRVRATRPMFDSLFDIHFTLS